MWPTKGPRRMRRYSDTRAANAYMVWRRACHMKLCLRGAINSGEHLSYEASRKKPEDKERCERIRGVIDDDDR